MKAALAIFQDNWILLPLYKKWSRWFKNKFFTDKNNCKNIDNISPDPDPGQ